MVDELKVLPLLITRGSVLFPKTSINIDVGRIFSISTINRSLDEFDSKIIVTTQKDVSINEPSDDDIELVGNLCVIGASKELNGLYRIRVTSISRIKITNIIHTKYHDKDSYECEYEEYPLENEDSSPKSLSGMKEIVKFIADMNNMVNVPRPILYKLQGGVTEEEFTNILGNYLDFPFNVKQALLEESLVSKRIEILKECLINTKMDEQIENDLNKIVRDKADQSQKEF